MCLLMKKYYSKHIMLLSVDDTNALLQPTDYNTTIHTGIQGSLAVIYYYSTRKPTLELILPIYTHVRISSLSLL